MDYLRWSESLIEKLVKAGFEFDLVHKAFKEAKTAIELEYKKGELSSAGACFIKAFEKYDIELKLSRERGQTRNSRELAKAYNISEAEARSGWEKGTKKKLAILSGFRGGEVDFSVKKRKVLYYLPLIYAKETIKLSNFTIKPFLHDSTYSSLLSDSVFDGKGSIIEVDGFESGDYLDRETDFRIFDALEKLKFGYFFLNPSYSGSFEGYVSSENFECFRLIEKNPDGAFEQKVELTNGMFAFSESLHAYYQYRISHQQKPIYLSTAQLSYVGLLTDGLDSADHMSAMRMYNRCWGTYSIHSHYDKALLAKVSSEVLLSLKGIKKNQSSKVFSEKMMDTINRFAKSSQIVSHIKEQFLIQGLDLEKEIELNLEGLKEARDKISHNGVPDYSYINVPFYLVWFPLFWLVMFCNEKLTEEEGIRFSLFCGLMCFNVPDWQKSEFTMSSARKSHLQIYVDNSKHFPQLLKKTPSESQIDIYFQSITHWLNPGNESKEQDIYS